MEAGTDTPEVDYLSMSDSDFRDAPTPEFIPASSVTEVEVEELIAPVLASDDELADDDEIVAVADKTLPAATDELTEDDEDESTSTEGEEETATEESEGEDPEVNPDDLNAQLKRILEPFKANGVEIKVDTVDDALKLMQMGANYNKKMTALKPNLRIIKMLESHGMLDESKLNHMIELEQGNPDAIAKLMRDKKVDPLDLSQEEDVKYEPKNYSVSHGQMELDDAISSIQETPYGANTLDIVGNKWDDSSKHVLAQHPQALLEINEQVGNGTFERINQEVQRHRMLGSLQGMSDLQAYQAVGKHMASEGKLNAPAAQLPASIVETTVKVAPKAAATKKAAAAPQSSPKIANKLTGINPLDMSDEDFAKATLDMF